MSCTPTHGLEHAAVWRTHHGTPHLAAARLHGLTGHGQAASEETKRGAAWGPLSAQEAPCYTNRQGGTGGRRVPPSPRPVLHSMLSFLRRSTAKFSWGSLVLEQERADWQFATVSIPHPPLSDQ